MNAKIKEWIKHNCQQTPTKQRLEFNVNSSGETFEMYLKDDFQGYLATNRNHRNRRVSCPGQPGRRLASKSSIERRKRLGV